MRKAKIVCTIDPVSVSLAMLGRLIEHGMDAARLNFSYGPMPPMPVRSPRSGRLLNATMRPWPSFKICKVLEYEWAPSRKMESNSKSASRCDYW